MATHKIRRCLAGRIGHHSYDMWFGDTTMLEVEGSCVRVATDSRFVADWINGHFRGELDGAARETLGERASVDLQVAPERFEAKARRSGAASPAARTRRSPRALPQHRSRRPTAWRRLEDFMVGLSNKLAYAAAVRMAEQNVGHCAPLYLHGECGVGKTHLLQGIVQRFSEGEGGRSGSDPDSPGTAGARYLTAEHFTNDYITSVRTGKIDQFRKRIRKLKLLAVDDVHFLFNKVATQNEFLHTIDSLDLSGGRIVLASDEHPTRVGFNQALGSRFVAGMVAGIDRPDPATRLKLVNKLAIARGLRLSAPAAESLASRCGGSVRELEGCVNKLTALRLVSGAAVGAEVGLVLVEQLYRDGSWRPAKPVCIGTVIDVVCGRMVVGRPDLMSSGRHRRVVAARGLVAYLARELTTLSYPEIAQALGRKHHSTVHTAVARMTRHLREQSRIEVGDDGRTSTIGHLLDQLRYEIVKAAKSA